MYYVIIGILGLVMIILTCIIIFQRKNNQYKSDNVDRFMILRSIYDSLSKDVISLKEQLDYYEEEAYQRNGGFETLNGIIQKKPIFKGKKALVGDYCSWSARSTKNTLKSLGFDVDIVESGIDIIRKMKNKEYYDVIFSNNIYQNGTGPDCLKQLRQLPDFSTPVVIHTASKDKEDEFVNVIGFDGFVAKPVTQEKLIPVLKKLLDKE